MYAQTNIQLLNQLQRDGYSKDELGHIFIVYELAMRLFPGLYRPSGKPLIAHLVGTASILSSLHASPKLVAAGLLHAVYAFGDFGSLAKGISDAKRAQIRRAVGQEVEEYIARYTALRWNSQTIPTIRDGLHALDPIDRDVVLLRLANALDDYMDRGVLYSWNAEPRRQFARRIGPVMVDIAERLGFPTLAADLADVFRETILTEIPVELRGSQDGKRFIVPQSYRRRLLITVYQGLVSGIQFFKRVVRYGKRRVLEMVV